MRKFTLFLMSIMFCVMLGLTSCDGCKQTPATPDTPDTTAVANETGELVVENLIAMDRQEMYTEYGDSYVWYETCILLDEYLDEDCDGSIAEVVNVMQGIIEDETGADTYVYKFQHFADGTYAKDNVHGFWVEDEALNEEKVPISFLEAYEKLMATNLPKPHSRYCTLRKQVGPIDANAQYIFGNVEAQVYVDAVTGAVSDVNPAFGPDKEPVFNGPLGEWP